MEAQSHQRTKVFISYCHQDAEWLQRLRVHLRPLERKHGLDIWDDTMLKPGSKWREEIRQALAATKVAVLLVTADFLASDFIEKDELPPLLSAAEKEGATILPVILSASLFESTNLAQFQAVNPLKPLVGLGKAEQEAVLVKVSEAIEASLNPPPETVTGYGERGVLRRKPFILPGLVGFFLGLVCAVALMYLGYWTPYRPPTAGNTPAPIATSNLLGEGGRDIVYLFGSGTVYTYLTSSAPNIFEKLKENENISVDIMQGPSGTGANVFAHAFDQMRHPINKSRQPVLVMASRRLDINELSQSIDKPRFVFEVYLGADALQMLLVTGDKHPKPISRSAVKALAAKNISALKEAFPGIFTSNNPEDRLDFATLIKTGKWITEEKWGTEDQWKRYGVYVGSGGSGTIDVWKKRLGIEVWEQRLGIAWPMEFKFWDIRNPEQIIELAPSNRIYLGSEVLNNVPAAMLKNNGIFHGKLTMVDELGPVKRGLYLYGLVEAEEKNKVNNQGHRLPKSVGTVLKHVLDSLKDKEPFLSEECRRRQIDYFNLEPKAGSEVGWVGILSDTEKTTRIYRAQPCAEQPKE